ncbi:MAG: PD-(D/E)XK nuclease family protein [Clostridia bacterium]
MELSEKYIDKLDWRKNERGYADGYLKLKIPSVSTVLGTIPDPEFDQWKIDMGDKADAILEAAGHRGTAMHCFLEHFCKEMTVCKDKNIAIKKCLDISFKTLNEENIPLDKINKGRNMFYNFFYSEYPERFTNVIASELKLYSPTYLYRGALDIAYNYNGLVISDFKSASSYLKPGTVKEQKYKTQLGAYALMVEDMSKKTKIDKSSIICLSTNSENIQEICIEKEELEYYKEEFKKLVFNWHRDTNQEFLFL